MNNELTFRLATTDDLADIVKMLSDDMLGATREKFETVLSEKYLTAFENIVNDKNSKDKFKISWTGYRDKSIPIYN